MDLGSIGLIIMVPKVKNENNTDREERKLGWEWEEWETSVSALLLGKLLHIFQTHSF